MRTSDISARITGLLMAVGVAVAVTGAGAALPARADQIVQTPQAPVIVIRSSSGLVTVVGGGDGTVRIFGDGASTSTFQIVRDDQGLMIPGSGGRPSRRLALPGVRQGTLGVRIDNSGGDVTVYVPKHVAAMLVRLDGGDAALRGFRGQYVIVAGDGSVELRAIEGGGHVRTTNGRVTLFRVGGAVHVETTTGDVWASAMTPERAEVRTQSGDIDWDAKRLGAGPYRFRSEAGAVRLRLSASQAANVDAQSAQGTVVNRFARAVGVRFRSPHAMSLTLSGGGAEVTAASESGSVQIGPRPQSPPQ